MGDFLLGTADHILFILIGLVIPFMAIIQGKPDMSELNFSSKQKIALYYSNGLIMWIASFLILGAWLFYGRSIASFGFSIPIMGVIVVGCTLGFVILYLGDLIFETLNPSRKQKTINKLSENTPFLPSNSKELAHFTFAAFTAGVCEEIIFRGFFINYLLAFSGHTIVGQWSSILLPALLFSVVHIYQGHKAVLKILLAGILFGLIYYFSRSLLIVIILHFVMDMISAYVAMRLLNPVTVEH